MLVILKYYDGKNVLQLLTVTWSLNMFLMVFLYLSMQVISKILGGICIESGSDFQKFLRVDTYTSYATALKNLEAMLPVYQSRVGALLFLISALLSRGLVLFLFLFYMLKLFVLFVLFFSQKMQFHLS